MWRRPGPSVRRRRESEVRRVEGVAGPRVAAVVAGREPAHPLLGRAVGEAVGIDPALGLLLDVVVADRLRGIVRRLDVARGERLQEAGRGRVVRPDPGVAIGLELGPNRAAFGPRVVASGLEVAEQVLDVVAVLV